MTTTRTPARPATTPDAAAGARFPVAAPAPIRSTTLTAQRLSAAGPAADLVALPDPTGPTPTEVRDAPSARATR